MELYDVTIKRFKDGSVQYRANLLTHLYNSATFESPKQLKEYDPIRSAKESYRQTLNKLYDLVHNNEWEWFFTLTLNEKKIGDRYDFVNCASFVHRFTDLVYHKFKQCSVKYIIVPERHKDGAWHFHGLLSGIDKQFLDINNYGYYYIPDYHFGFSSMSPVVDSKRVANYILKYMVKGFNYLDIPKGKRKYFASRNLEYPEIEYDILDSDRIEELKNNSYYVKQIDNEFYHGYIIDCKEDIL